MKTEEFRISNFILVIKILMGLFLLFIFSGVFLNNKSIIMLLLALYVAFTIGWFLYVYIITPRKICLYTDKLIILNGDQIEYSYC